MATSTKKSTEKQEVQQIIRDHLNDLFALDNASNEFHCKINFIKFLVLNYPNVEEVVSPSELWSEYVRDVEENGFRTVGIGY